MSDFRPRKPAAFRLDDPQVHMAVDGPGDEEVRPRGRRGVVILPETDNFDLPAVIPEVTVTRRRFPWATMFWSALGGLVSLASGLAIVHLLEDLFARAQWLGWFGVALAAMVAIALLILVAREAIGLFRLAAIEKLRARAVTVIALDDRDSARTLVRELLAFSRPVARFARGRSALESHLSEIIDGADLLRLAERELMAPLDEEARQFVSSAAKRVSIVTAVSPRAAVDLIFVFITAIRMIRALAELYGGRPGMLGLLRLVRLVITHLAVTGGMAAGDNLVQQMLGHGVAAKVSARLGEGVLNGLLTARLGMAAIEVARPLPFMALRRPSMSDLAGGLLRKRRGEPADPDLPAG